MDQPVCVRTEVQGDKGGSKEARVIIIQGPRARNLSLSGSHGPEAGHHEKCLGL